ncbi:MAG: hypothetical protein ACJ8HI_23655 [Massilia sp.]
MSLRKKLRQEIRLHLMFLSGAWVTIPFYYFAYRMGWFFGSPPAAVVGYGIFVTLCLYVWWRQCLSPDKTRFHPK